MSTLDYLRELLALLSVPGQHTTHTTARDKMRRCVPAEHADAVCWCLYGGVIKACMPGERAAVFQALHAELLDPDEFSLGNLTDFNDQHPDKVLPLIERAIEREAAHG